MTSSHHKARLAQCGHCSVKISKVSMTLPLTSRQVLLSTTKNTTETKVVRTPGMDQAWQVPAPKGLESSLLVGPLRTLN